MALSTGVTLLSKYCWGNSQTRGSWEPTPPCTIAAVQKLLDSAIELSLGSGCY